MELGKSRLIADCDFIHDVGRETSIRIYHYDAVMSDVTFHNIRARMGRIVSPIIRDHATLELIGFDTVQAVEGVFEDVVLDGNKVKGRQLIMNDFVKDVQF